MTPIQKMQERFNAVIDEWREEPYSMRRKTLGIEAINLQHQIARSI